MAELNIIATFVEIKIIMTKETIFLKKAGYTIEEITYTVFEDGGRYCDDSYSNHKVSLAYKIETPEIKKFKEIKYHHQQAHKDYKISNFILGEVYKKEFDNALYEMASRYVSRRELNDNF